jgi:excisionase family DNA binding protein
MDIVVSDRVGFRSMARKARTGGPPTKLVSVKELSRYLNVSRATIRNLIKAGQIPYCKVGSQYRFDVLAVRAAIEKRI